MFLEVEVAQSDNSPMELTRIFDALEAPFLLSRVVSADLAGTDTLCDVTGWSSIGPCPCYTALVEDSGEGVARLIYGGDEGIRLKRADCEEEWGLDSPRQWGEACLLLDKDLELR